MNTLIIVIILGILIGAAISYLEYGYLSDAVAGAISGAICGAIVGFTIAAIIGALVYTDSHWEQTARKPLISLADGSDVHGQFSGGLFLSTGYVEGSPSYTWYEARGENNFVRRDVDATEATIHYVRDGVPPYYTIREKKADDTGFWQPWGWNSYDPWGEAYDFYVPRGSITHAYILDNK